MKTITRDKLRETMDKDEHLRLIDVLPPESFHEEHLPGAENVPLSESFDERIEQAIPNKGAEVVVYCANTECPASEKAVKRMEDLGYTNVLEYVEGKEGWKQAGMPTEAS